MLKGSYTESDTQYGNYGSDKYEFIPDLCINYKLTTDLSMVDKKDTQKRQADLNAKLQEIQEYDEKIAHIANQRISIDLDDGVKVNYEKFKDILAKIR